MSRSSQRDLWSLLKERLEKYKDQVKDYGILVPERPPTSASYFSRDPPPDPPTVKFDKPYQDVDRFWFPTDEYTDWYVWHGEDRPPRFTEHSGVQGFKTRCEGGLPLMSSDPKFCPKSDFWDQFANFDEGSPSPQIGESVSWSDHFGSPDPSHHQEVRDADEVVSERQQYKNRIVTLLRKVYWAKQWSGKLQINVPSLESLYEQIPYMLAYMDADNWRQNLLAAKTLRTTLEAFSCVPDPSTCDVTISTPLSGETDPASFAKYLCSLVCNRSQEKEQAQTPSLSPSKQEGQMSSPDSASISQPPPESHKDRLLPKTDSLQEAGPLLAPPTAQKPIISKGAGGGGSSGFIIPPKPPSPDHTPDPPPPPPPSPIPPPTSAPDAEEHELKRAKQEKQEEDELMQRIKSGEGEGERGGFVLPSHHYTGPRNPVPAGKPADPVDESSARHDIRYGQRLKHGDWPYLWGKDLDNAQRDEIIKALQSHVKVGTQLAGNIVRSIWKAKELLTEPVYELLKSILPPSDLSKVPLPHSQQTDRTEDPETPGETRGTGSDSPRSPRPSGSTEDGGGPSSESRLPGTKVPVDPSATTSDAKRQRTEEGMDISSCCPGGISASGAASNNSGLACGGGGGTNLGTESLVSGCQFGKSSVVTSSFRRCLISPWPDKYCCSSAHDLIPGVVYETPWCYYDLNVISAHFSPSAWQRLLEDYDAFRPKSLKVTIQSLVFKDVCQGAEKQTTVQDSQSATIAIFEDKDYDYPYVMGGGQKTVPGHLPGQPYNLPKYSYRTLGSVKESNRASMGGSGYTFKSNQDTELFLLETHDSTLIRGGGTFEQYYEFPNDLPFENLTQYPWDIRRQDNPLYQQRITVMSGSDRDTVGILDGDFYSPFRFKGHDRPAMWLPGQRLIQGKFIDTHPIPNTGRSGVHPNDFHTRGDGHGDTHRTHEERIYSLDTGLAAMPRAAHRPTLQPGPRTLSHAVRRPDGSTVVTANACAYAYTQENPHQEPWSDLNVRHTMYRLAYQRQKGFQQPGDPLHIRTHACYGDGDVTIPKEESLWPTVLGSCTEKSPACLESQIWCKTPNVDMVYGEHTPPLALWGMRAPPPHVFLRMLAQEGPPNVSTCRPAQSGQTFINQYGQFLLCFTMVWEVKPRPKSIKQWNPRPPISIPVGQSGPAFILDQDGYYRLPEHVWSARERIRSKR
nr:capsid protein [Porcine parvovirus 6]